VTPGASGALGRQGGQVRVRVRVLVRVVERVRPRRGALPVLRRRRGGGRGVREDLAAEPEVVPAQPVGPVRGPGRRVAVALGGLRPCGVARRLEERGLQAEQAGPDALEHGRDALLVLLAPGLGARRAGAVAGHRGRRGGR
jgi:hypothetical protein